MNRYSLSLLRYLGVLAAVSAVGMGLPACGSETSPETDREALEILYHATDGPNWLRNLNWMTGAPLGEWSGVTTNDDGRVTGLDLAANELDGGIPPELGNLDRLRVLDLTGSRTEVKLEIKGQGSGLGGLIDQAVGQAADQLADPANRTVRRNHLSGCIPSSLQDQLDLESSNLVGLSFCGEGIDGVAPERPTGRPATQSGDSQGGSPEAGVSGNSFPADTQPSRSSGSSSSFPDQDREALAALFEATNGPGWLNNENWLSDQPVDNWYGVRVDGNAPMFGVGVTRYYRASAVNSASAGAPSNVAINEAQAGEFTLSMLRPVVGTALTATLGGPDGDVTGMMWPWAKPKDMASGWNDIDGATPAAYTQVEEDEGYYLETVVSHTDGRGFGKSAAAVTARVVTADGDSLIARYDANGNGMIERSEVITAINDYLFGEGDGVISRSDVIRLINLYLFGPSTPPNPPEAPTGLMAAENGQTRIDLSWSAPSSDGGSAITGYRIEVSEDRTDWSDLVVNTGSTATSYSHTGLTAGSTRHYRVSAINSAGTGPPSNIATGTTPPEPTTPGTATSDRAALVALYNGMDGPTWPNSDNWLTDAPLDEWFGVTTDGSTGRVIDLTLIGNNLKGQLPPELGDLTALEGLNLGGNFIYDYNLPTLSDLTNLRRLSLFQNFISDVSALSSLTRLEILDLSDNGVSDISPLLDLPNLRFLSVWANPLTGRSIDEHIPVLQARGVEVAYADIAFTGGGFTAEDGPQLYSDNLFILPVEPDEHVRDYAASFYRYFEDEFDFLMFITTDRLVRDTRAAGWFEHVINDVQGIGLDVFSHTQEYGSAGKLQGVTVFTAVHEFRIVALHELMHRWGAFILPGEVSVGPHWFEVSNAYGVLDGGYVAVPFDEIVALGGDRYSVTPPPPGTWVNTFGPLELYLAGFIPPEEVPDFWVAPDAEWVEWLRIFTASEIRRYTIDDVIAVHGRRVPEAAQAQREFRAAAILLIDENHAASMDVLEWLSRDVALFSHAGAAEDGQSNFYEGTGGRAKIVMDGLSQFRKDRDGE